MKLFTLITVLFLVSTNLLAADFRSLDFGDSCADINREEYRSGNTPKTSSDSPDEHYAFNGVFLDRTTTITYYCGKDDIFDQGLYLFTFTSEQDLNTFFEIAKLNLEYLLGPPTFDGTKLSSESFNSVFRYDLRWDKEHATISTKVIGNFDGSNSQKRLQIWYRPVK